MSDDQRATKGAGIARDGAVEITRAREMYTRQIHLQNLQLREKEALEGEDNNNKYTSPESQDLLAAV